MLGKVLLCLGGLFKATLKCVCLKCIQMTPRAPRGNELREFCRRLKLTVCSAVFSLYPLLPLTHSLYLCFRRRHNYAWIDSTEENYQKLFLIVSQGGNVSTQVRFDGWLVGYGKRLY